MRKVAPLFAAFLSSSQAIEFEQKLDISMAQEDETNQVSIRFGLENVYDQHWEDFEQLLAQTLEVDDSDLYNAQTEDADEAMSQLLRPLSSCDPVTGPPTLSEEAILKQLITDNGYAHDTYHVNNGLGQTIQLIRVMNGGEDTCTDNPVTQ